MTAPTPPERCPTCGDDGDGDFGHGGKCPDPFHTPEQQPVPGEDGERWTVWVCPDCREHRAYLPPPMERPFCPNHVIRADWHREDEPLPNPPPKCQSVEVVPASSLSTLKAAGEEMERALEPFVEATRKNEKILNGSDSSSALLGIKVGDLRAARSALSRWQAVTQGEGNDGK